MFGSNDLNWCIKKMKKFGGCIGKKGKLFFCFPGICNESFMGTLIHKHKFELFNVDQNTKVEEIQILLDIYS